MIDMFAEMRRYAALLDDSPRITRLECGYLVPDTLRAICVKGPEPQPWEPADLSGVPVVVKTEMAPSAWQAIDQYGQVMRSGQL